MGENEEKKEFPLPDGFNSMQEFMDYQAMKGSHPYVVGEDPLLDELREVGLLKPHQEILAINGQVIDWDNPEDRAAMKDLADFLKIELAQKLAIEKSQEEADGPNPLRDYFQGISRKFDEVPSQFGIKMDAHVSVPHLLDMYGDQIALGFYNHPEINLGKKDPEGVTLRVAGALYQTFLAGIAIGNMYDFDESELTEEYGEYLIKTNANDGMAILEEEFSDTIYHEGENIDRFIETVFNTWIGNFRPDMKDGEPDLDQIRCGLVATLALGISMILYKKGY